MGIRDYRDLNAWKFARELERRVYAVFDASEGRVDADFCRQIRRSASSAPRNMAEGFGRFWPAEFAHKLRIAIGELRETQDHLDRAAEERWLTEIPHEEMKRLADRAIGAAIRFAEYLDRHGGEWKKNYQLHQRQLGKKRSESRGSQDTRNDSYRDTYPAREEEPAEPTEPTEPVQPTEPKPREP